MCGTTSDRKLERILLSNMPTEESRPLSKTGVCKSLVKLRDDLVRKELNLQNTTAVTRRYKKHHTSLLMAAEDTYAAVTLPPRHGAVQAQVINVLKDKPGKPLWFEATAENLMYLMSVVDAERMSGEFHNIKNATDDIVPSDLVGASRAKGHVRARRRDSGGKTTNKYCKIGDDPDSAVNAAKMFFVWQ